MKTDEIIEEAEYFSFLSVNAEFREEWNIKFLFRKSKTRGLELFNAYQMLGKTVGIKKTEF